MIRIAVDAMSGDLGPRVAIAAAIQAVASFPELELLLVGEQSQLQSLVATEQFNSRLKIIHAPDVVAMDEDPLFALRHKKQSSMWCALNLVREGAADACVSAGNTGALLAMSKYLLKTFPSIDRPAICKSLPVARGHSYMLDLGANLKCDAQQLHQFALMGSVLASALSPSKPGIALLNVGRESNKGTAEIKAAHDLLLADERLRYIGFIEGDEIYSGSAEVIVCDGFSGNVALKSSEGVARLIRKKIAHSFSKSWYLRALGLLVRPVLNQLRTELDPGTYNGAIFLGLQNVVVKGHGSSDQQAFVSALVVAKNQVAQKIPERIQQKLQVIM